MIKIILRKHRNACFKYMNKSLILCFIFHFKHSLIYPYLPYLLSLTSSYLVRFWSCYSFTSSYLVRFWSCYSFTSSYLVRFWSCYSFTSSYLVRFWSCYSFTSSYLVRFWSCYSVYATSVCATRSVDWVDVTFESIHWDQDRGLRVFPSQKSHFLFHLSF